MKKRGLFSWVLEFAGRKRAYFGGSVLLTMLGVAKKTPPQQSSVLREEVRRP